MTASPLQRVIASIGLASLVPIAMQLVTEAITPQAAATRALAVIAVAMLLTMALRGTVTALVGRFERPASPTATNSAAWVNAQEGAPADTSRTD